MLVSLQISNLAVIHRLRVDFQPGLNLLTGETGSGKSIIVDALGLLMGERSSTTQIRTGERLAVVEGNFRLNEKSREIAFEILSETGIEAADLEELIIRREISSQGRSRIFVNDRSVNLASLKLLQPLLVEIHGQGEQQSLLYLPSHLELLDNFAGCLPSRQALSELFDRWKKARQELEALQRELAERERMEDLLNYELKEIESVSPVIGEDEKLLAERKFLANAERIFELSGNAFGVLYENDENVLSMLAQVRRHLEELAGLDIAAAQYFDELRTAMASLGDLADGIRTYVNALDFSPQRLAEIEQRLVLLERLKRKYSTDLDGILQVKDDLAGRLSKLKDLADNKQTVEARLKVLATKYTRMAGDLSKSRRKAAPVLASEVLEELGRLAMEQAKFVVGIETAQAFAGERYDTSVAPETVNGKFFTPTGADTVEFLLSANPGELPRPLARAVSGGELSRLMLTLRLVGMRGSQRELAQTNETFIFDEIDAGIGGRVAESVGQRLKALSAVRQVLCVTHQPQIASFADQHYRVDKYVEDGRTVTSVKDLSGDERVEEIARMIGGSHRTDKTLEVARWLIDNAKNYQNESQRPASRHKVSKKR